MSTPIQPDIACKLPSVADPALSSDGSHLAYTYSWFDQVQMESYSRIMMLKVPGSRAQEFTQGKSDSVPKFAPNGNDLGFLRLDEAGRRQLWVMGVGGGEAKCLTAAPGGVLDFRWSPDGGQVVYCANVDSEAPNQDQQANKVPQVKVVSRIRYRFDGLGWRGDAHFHLFVVSLAGDSPRQLTDGDWDDTAPVWSPDGTRIAFISGRRDDRDQKALTEAYVVPVAGGEAENWSQGLSDVGVLSWSPDSRRLVAVGSDMPQGMALWQAWLFVLEPGGPPQRLTDDSLRPILSVPTVSRPPELRWTEDGRVLFLGDQRGETRLFEVPASGGPCRPLAGGGWQSSSVTIDGSAQGAVVLSSYPGSPGELYYLDLISTANEKLTHCNEEYLADHPPARMEKFNVQREDLQIECRLWLPPGFDRSRQYPMVLDIHGGPNGAFYDSFTPVQQVLATSGFLVLAVNPRGSSTYGKEFMMSVLGDWGGEDYQDLMAAVDELAARPYVDGQRLGVHGYSYGGFMTSWIVGHNDRFKAAVVGAPCIDLYSMYGTSDIGVSFGEDQWGGTLVDAAQELIKHSPITYAANVNTPVLLLHGEADARCPVAQSEEYFVVLKRLGKEVEFVRFPECNHQFPRMGHPKMREEYLARTLEWFQKWLG